MTRPSETPGEGPPEPAGESRSTQIRLGAGREFDLIRRFLAGSDVTELPARVRIGAGDDCAVIADIVVGSDLSVEDVHFRRSWLTAEEIGYRAAAAALSDLAAMAAQPVGVLVAIMLPQRDAATPAPGEVSYGEDVMAGVRAAAGAVGAALIGGDVARSSGPLALDVVVIGESKSPLLRSGGRAGDELWVTGPLGAAAAAVVAWTRGDQPGPAARSAFARPAPRVREAMWLAERDVAQALIDISDGLAGDAGHIAAASGLEAVLDAAAVPVHPAALEVASDAESALRLALTGGEDYELLVAARPGALGAVARELEAATGTRLHRVGELGPGAGVCLRRPDGAVEPLGTGGYDHFGGGEG